MIDQLIANFQGFCTRARLTWRLMQDDRVPMWLKAIPVASVLYLFSPIDVLPDVFLAFGQIDDVMILIGAMELFERFAPADVVAEHRLQLEEENLQINP